MFLLNNKQKFYNSNLINMSRQYLYLRVSNSTYFCRSLSKWS